MSLSHRAGVGEWENRGLHKKNNSPHLCGGSVFAENCVRRTWQTYKIIVVVVVVVVVVVEWCRIIIIYYCWQGSTASLASRLREMITFVKILRLAEVKRVAPDVVVVLLGLSGGLWPGIFCAQAW